MGTILFTINSYMAELKATGHDNVPTSRELAKHLDMTPSSFSRLANNRRGGPDRYQLAALITFFRSRDFDTSIGDLLRFIES